MLIQQDLIKRMIFPKQTITSAVIESVRKGLVELQMIPGTRSRKTIQLTESGIETAKATVERMHEAQERAAESLALTGVLEGRLDRSLMEVLGNER